MVCTHGISLGVDFAGFGASVQGVKELAGALRQAEDLLQDPSALLENPTAAIQDAMDIINAANPADLANADILIFEQGPEVSIGSSIGRCGSRVQGSFEYSYTNTKVNSLIYGTSATRHSHRLLTGITIDHDPPRTHEAPIMEMRILDHAALGLAVHRGDVEAHDLELSIGRSVVMATHIGPVSAPIAFQYSIRLNALPDSGPPSGSRPRWTVSIGVQFGAGPRQERHDATNDLGLDEALGAGAIIALSRPIALTLGEVVKNTEHVPSFAQKIILPTVGIVVERPADAAHDLVLASPGRKMHRIPQYSLLALETSLAIADLILMSEKDKSKERIAHGVQALTNIDRALDTTLALAAPKWRTKYKPVADTAKYGLMTLVSMSGDDDIHLALQYRGISMLINETLLKPAAKHLGWLSDSENTLW